MCKTCCGSGLVSVVATWAFFALLLSYLGIASVGLKAIWLTILMCIAAFCCPICNPKIGECCQAKPKKKK